MSYTLLKDRIAKKLLTSPKVGKRYSAAIIACILDLDEEDVYNNLEYIHPEVSSNANIVNSESDVVFMNDDNYINIEINLSKGYASDVKNGTYIAHLYLKQLKSSEDYNRIKKVIQINLNAYDYFGKSEFLYHSILTDTRYHLVRNSNIEIFDISLPILGKIDYNDIMNERERLEKLLYVFVCSDDEFLNELYSQQTKVQYEYLKHVYQLQE